MLKGIIFDLLLKYDFWNRKKFTQSVTNAFKYKLDYMCAGILLNLNLQKELLV